MIVMVNMMIMMARDGHNPYPPNRNSRVMTDAATRAVVIRLLEAFRFTPVTIKDAVLI